MNDTKCFEYYLDSRVYSNEEVRENIEETKKEFSKKKVNVDVRINSFGMYVITFYFENKSTIWNRIRIYFKRKTKKTMLLQEKNSVITKTKTNHQKLEKKAGRKYGEYKATKTYRPY